jgi:hypothetical protein
MNSLFVSCIAVIALALVALGVDAAWADHGQPKNDPRASGPATSGLPASVRRIERETGGEVLKAQPIQRDGREVYRVKVLTPQGRIRVVEDAAPPRDGTPANDRDSAVRSQQRDRLPEE